jgi:hypothetical protein
VTGVQTCALPIYVVKKGIILSQVVDLIIYDEIPDIVLDRINKFKKAGAVVSLKTQ